jgi:acid phosphatase type 7
LLYRDGVVGDEFQDSIESITSTVPVRGCPGNHEGAQGFVHYTNRFRVFNPDNSSGMLPTTIPGLESMNGTLPNNHYYSFNIGLAHIVAFSTELYFTTGGAAIQYAWLEQDLASVNRTETPWIFVYGHRSIYCSCDSDCDDAATAVRDGPYGMEALLNKYGVEVFVNGHEHNYERNAPVYNFTLMTVPTGAAGGNAANPQIVTDQAAPVYIVSGCAGDVEHHEPFTRAQPSYSAYRSNTYGYSRMTVYNSTHLLWEQIQTDNEYPETTGTVIDAMLLIKHSHGPFNN